MSSGVTLKQLLPSRLDAMEDTVEQELRNNEEPDHSLLAWRFIKSTAADELRGALDCDVFDVIARGWCKARELHEFSDPASHPPGQTTVVHLGEHALPTSVHPILSIRVGGVQCLSLKFTVEVTANFRSAALSIRNGHIIAVAPGDASVSAQLKYGKVKLHKAEESPKVQLPGHVAFKAPGLEIG